jgi:hypothetical protein
VEPPFLRATESSELVLDAHPVNILGFKVPFKHINVQFIVEEGKNLVELISNQDNHSAVVRSKGIEGEVIISIYSEKGSIPVTKVLIEILPVQLAFDVDAFLP